MTANDHRCEPTARSTSERLRLLRLQAGLTQAVLALRLGTTQSAIARLERGLHRISLESVNRVAAALGCETALLIAQRRSA